MIADLKPYAEYKESGQEWLGRVPKHWDVVPLGRALMQRIEQNRPIKTKDILSLSLHQGVIPYSEKKTGGNKAKDDLSAYVLAYPGDIVLNSMNVVVGSVGLSKYFGAVSPVYYVLRTRSSSDLIQFFDAVFQNRTFQQSLWGLGNGIMVLQSKTTGKLNTIRMRIPMSALRRVSLPCPRPNEQAAIVRFLDHANRKIDTFIRAKRKVIALLNEQKQAIIHRAVTRGLDPGVKLKPSGIPWLGDIPAHWEVRPLKAVCKIQSGITLGKDYAGQTTHEYPYLRVANVQAGHANLAVVKTIRVTNAEAMRCTLQDGDVLMTRVAILTSSDVAAYGTHRSLLAYIRITFLPCGRISRTLSRIFSRRSWGHVTPAPILNRRPSKQRISLRPTRRRLGSSQCCSQRRTSNKGF